MAGGFNPRQVDYSTEELLAMPKEEATKGLNERQQRFCEFYISSNSAKSAAVRAGYFVNEHSQNFLALKSNWKVQRYIAWLKVRVYKKAMLSAEEVIDEWIRIGFSDITDFVDIFPHSFRLKPSDQIDGQLVKSIKSGRDGISIELYDKMKALDSLVKYMDCMPTDWKQRLEERKLQLMENEFELKKKAVEGIVGSGENDGFLEALSKTAEKIWEK